MSGEAPDADEVVRRVGAVLNDPARPLKERFRALFTLRNLGGAVAVDCISQCFGDESELLKHELAYCLGQMQDAAAVPALVSVLEDRAQHAMVRHEAGEALAAIGAQSSRPVLQRFVSDPAPEVAETCALALRRLAWLAESAVVADAHPLPERPPDNPFRSVDPAPPCAAADVRSLRALLLDDAQPLFERYRAMFTLRNLGTPDSVDALADALCVGSALFRHEVAFVLGQLQDPRTVPALRRSLEDAAENEMVRHEAAEALGAIATDECIEILRRYTSDARRVVRESCEVALDVCEYENSPEFQYADTLLKVAA